MNSKDKVFVNQIKEGDTIQSVFLVVNKELRPKKAEGQYLRLVLADKTGEIVGNKWDNLTKSIISSIQINDYAEIQGYAKLWQNRLQLNIQDIKKIEPSEVDPTDFMKVSDKSPDDMWNDLSAHMDEIEDPYLKRLLKDIFSDQDLKNKFIIAPAAKALHHSFHSGLLEHTLSLVKLARFIADHYESLRINKDLLITGAILHDLGKTYELSYEGGFDYTDEGRLIGHITITAIQVQKHIDNIDGFPKDLAMQLIHMLLSHHGHYEFGSPKRPKTLEAVILYYLDDMDAKVESMYSFITENLGKGKWAGFDSKHFERFIFKGSLIDSDNNEGAD